MHAEGVDIYAAALIVGAVMAYGKIQNGGCCHMYFFRYMAITVMYN